MSQGQGQDLSLDQSHESEPGVRTEAEPMPEPEVWAEKEPGHQHGSEQRLGRGLSLGRDRYWVEVELEFMAE